MKVNDLAQAGPYAVVVADPPWMYEGDPNKPQAAGKHYPLMPTEDIFALPVRTILAKRAVVYVWATSPKLPLAIDCGRHWGLRYVGVAFVWVKTNREGRVIHGQGVRPTITKPTTEYLLAFTNVPRGRPLPVLDEGMGQVVLAPRGAHSEKPAEVMGRIERLHGPWRRLEMFARGARDGWDAWGNEAPEG